MLGACREIETKASEGIVIGCATDSGKHDDDCANIYAEFVTKFAG